MSGKESYRGAKPQPVIDCNCLTKNKTHITYSAYVHAISIMYDDYEENDNQEPHPFYPWVCMEDYEDMDITRVQEECRELNRQSNRPLLKVGLASKNKFYVRSGSVANDLFTGFGDEFFEDGSLCYRGYFNKGVYESRGILFNNKAYYSNYNAQIMLYEGNYKDGIMNGNGTFFFNNYKYQVLFKEIYSNMHVSNINIFMQYPDFNQMEFSAIIPRACNSPRRGYNGSPSVGQYVTNDRYFLRYSGEAIMTDAATDNPWDSTQEPSLDTVMDTDTEITSQCKNNRNTDLLHFNYFFLPDGIGEEYTPNGQKKYSGPFRRGLYEGEGIYNFSNGDTYSGGFVNGIMNGHGQYYEDHRKLIFKGIFSNGEINGNFEVILSNGLPVYYGYLKDGVMNGEGCIIDRSNRHINYIGTFSDGRLLTNHVRILYQADLLYEGSVSRNWDDQSLANMDSDYLWSVDAVNTVSADKSVARLLAKRDRRRESSRVSVSETKDNNTTVETISNSTSLPCMTESSYSLYADLITRLCYVPHGQGTLFYVSKQIPLSFSDSGSESLPSVTSVSHVEITDIVKSNTNASPLYCGFFNKGRFSDVGTLYYNDCDHHCLYTGCFNNHKYEGSGLCFDEHGCSYAGVFISGKPVGDFIVKSVNNRIIYEGTLSETLHFDGKGKYFYPDGSWFTGMWRDNSLLSNSSVFYGDIEPARVKWKGGVRAINPMIDLNTLCHEFCGKGTYYFCNGDYVQLSFNDSNEKITECVRIFSSNHTLLYRGYVNCKLHCQGEGILYMLDSLELDSRGNICEEWIDRTYLKLPYSRIHKLEKRNSLFSYLRSSQRKFIEFKGIFNDGVLHGNGWLTMDEGIEIDGIWEQGKLISARIYEGKHLIYEGEIKNGEHNGIGRVYRNDIMVLSGHFICGQLEGYGKQYSASTGAIIYDGNFVQGMYHGNGTSYYSSGVKQYSGGFIEGIPSGVGDEYDPNGVLRYVGGYEYGKRQGRGCIYINDMQYEGDFMDGSLQLEYVSVSKKVNSVYQVIYEGAIRESHREGRIIYEYDEVDEKMSPMMEVLSVGVPIDVTDQEQLPSARSGVHLTSLQAHSGTPSSLNYLRLSSSSTILLSSTGSPATVSPVLLIPPPIDSPITISSRVSVDSVKLPVPLSAFLSSVPHSGVMSPNNRLTQSRSGSNTPSSHFSSHTDISSTTSSNRCSFPLPASRTVFTPHSSSFASSLRSLNSSSDDAVQPSDSSSSDRKEFRRGVQGDGELVMKSSLSHLVYNNERMYTLDSSEEEDECNKDSFSSNCISGQWDRDVKLR